MQFEMIINKVFLIVFIEYSQQSYKNVYCKNFVGQIYFPVIIVESGVELFGHILVHFVKKWY